jgi:hypothetical protein
VNRIKIDGKQPGTPYALFHDSLDIQRCDVLEAT